jgi:transglutaminase-like putative cysteine protease
MLLRLLHRTTFIYDGQARDSFNEVRLRPTDDAGQSCRRFVLRTDPAAALRNYRDFYGNTVHYFDVAAGHGRLVVEAESQVETAPNEARESVPAVPAEALAAFPDREVWAEFFTDSHYVPLDAALWRETKDAWDGTRTDLWNDVRRLGRHIHRTFAYRPNSTGVNTRATDALKIRAGVCQDFAHVMLGMCRSAGIPSRYVSGYFLNPHRRPGEVEASHAWVEALIPGYGWAGYDPTHDRPADERYIKAAVGRDYADIRPVSGSYRGAPTKELKVVVQVRKAKVKAAAAP